MSTKLEEVLTKFQSEIPNFISTGIAEVESGLELLAISADPNFVTATAGASFSDVVKANAKGLDLLGIGAETTEDILITIKNGMILLRMLGANHYHGLAMGAQTPLGFARAIMKKYETPLLDALKAIT